MSETIKKTGAELIAEERKRQIEVEGYGAAHDRQHDVKDLIHAALAYLACARGSLWAAKKLWPWSLDTLKPTNRRDDLIKAGALIAAEIDRLGDDPQPSEFYDTCYGCRWFEPCKTAPHRHPGCGFQER